MCGIRRREMKMVLVLLWAAGAIVLGIGVFELFLTGFLGEILKKEETKTMLAQVLAVFLWNLLWLSRVKNRKAQILGISVGRRVDCGFDRSGKMAERMADGKPEKKGRSG